MSLPAIDEILNIDTDMVHEPLPVEPELPAVIEGEAIVTTASPVTPPVTPDTRLEDDFEFAREKMRDLIGKGREAIDSAILLAQSGDSPRAYEVVGSLLASAIAANRELINIHKVRQDTVDNATVAPSVDGGGGSVNINNAVFVGKASDLLRQIRQIASE